MSRRVGWLVVPLGWALACGGRFEQTDAEGSGAEGGTSTGQGGSVQSKAGTSSRAGTTGKGGSGTSGSVAVGGGCACGPVACAPGYLTVPTADGCCVQCQLDLEACAVNREGYRQLRQQLLDKYSGLGCTENADCTFYYEKNSCGINSCGIPIPVQGLMNLGDNLSSYAQMTCAPDCPDEPQPPCVDLPASCFKGYCQ